MMQESEVANEVSSVMENVPSTSQVLNSPINPVNLPSTLYLVLPEDVRPFPTAQQRKETQKGRPKGKSRILTDTPEKQLLEAAKMKNTSKPRLKNRKKACEPCLKKAKKKIFQPEDDSSESEVEISSGESVLSDDSRPDE